MSTKAAFQRWFAEREGREVDTVQVKPSGITWEPGLRTVARKGNVIRLDGSRVELSRTHVVIEVSDSRAVVEWQDEDGVRIHVTTYADPGGQ